MGDLGHISGVLTALVTSFRGDEIDEPAFADFVEWQIAQGADGLVPCSLTGEGPTLTPDEHVRLFRISVEAAAGRVPVVASVGANCTASAIDLTAAARRAGADAALIVTPYYNRPSQEGLFRHFEAVARAVDLPVLLHVIPSHTAVDLCPATLERLAAIPSIVGLCDEEEKSMRQLNAFEVHGLVKTHGLDRSASSMVMSGARTWICKIATSPPTSALRSMAPVDSGIFPARSISRRTSLRCVRRSNSKAPPLRSNTRCRFGIPTSIRDQGFRSRRLRARRRRSSRLRSGALMASLRPHW